MKYLILFLLYPIFISAQADYSASTDMVDWLTDYENALEASKKEKKNILVYFTGSDWCPPCKMLKKDLFESDDFFKFSDQYVLLYIDIPRNKNVLSPVQMEHNQKLLADFNKKSVFPLLKILDEKGNVLDEFAGYRMNGEVQYHLEMLEKHKS